MNIIATKLRAIAAELREHPERWTQGWWARDACGNSVDCTDERAVCWCARGFIRKDRPDWPGMEDAVDRAVPEADTPSANRIAYFNDVPGRTAVEVADLFDRAAELASQTAAPAGAGGGE